MLLRTSDLVARALIGLLLLAVLLVTAATLYEFVGFASQWIKTTDGDDKKLALSRDYEAVNRTYLHPIYFFFFPLNLQERKSLSNQRITITSNGFRGREPTYTKPLAVLLGGSVAFGHLSSSDETTITGYLNRIQDDFEFVNAAVPSWNSTQELHRLADQIIHLKPALVISFGLYNDVHIAAKYPHLPPGSPENFERFKTIVDRNLFAALLESLFPRSAKLLGIGHPAPPTRAEISAALDAANKKFLENEQAMQALSKGLKFRFVTVIPPIRSAGSSSNRRVQAYESVVQQALASEYCEENCLDYSNVFDQEFKSVTAVNRFFYDTVHFTDQGNEFIARRLASDLGLSKPAQAKADLR
jgi:lysophospholipase L1-like esterase